MRSSEMIKRTDCILLKEKCINDKMTEETTEVINRFDFIKIVSNTFLQTQSDFFFQFYLFELCCIIFCEISIIFIISAKTFLITFVTFIHHLYCLSEGIRIFQRVKYSLTV